MTDLDLLIAGGTVVTSTGRRRLHVGVRDGASPTSARRRRRPPAPSTPSGLFVLPGGVDTHVHLMDPGSPEREDFPTGTSAAAASGVTTIVEHSHGTPVRTVGDLREKTAYLRDRSNVDFGLAAHAWPGRRRGAAGCGRRASPSSRSSPAPRTGCPATTPRA